MQRDRPDILAILVERERHSLRRTLVGAIPAFSGGLCAIVVCACALESGGSLSDGDVERSRFALKAEQAVEAEDGAKSENSDSPARADEEAEEAEFMYFDGKAVSPMSLDQNLVRSVVTDDDRALIERMRAEKGIESISSRKIVSPSQSDRAIAAASKARPDDLIEIGIEIEDIPFKFSRMRDMDDIERTELVSERRAQLRSSQEATLKRVKNIGGRELSRDFLANVVEVLAPARHLPAIARWPGVKSISVSEPILPKYDEWTGRQIRNGVLTQAFLNAGLRRRFQVDPLSAV